MILLLVFFNIITQLIKLCFFFPHISLWGFCFYVCIPCLLLLLLLSCFFLSQLHSSCLTQCTHFISHNSSHLTSHTTHLTQLISHNSSHTTQLTQELLSCGIWWSCFRVLALNFTQVLSHNSSHNSHNSSHTTPLISQLTQLHSSHNSQNSSHTTPLMSQLTQLLSSHKSHNSSHTTHLSQLISHNSTHSRAAFVWHLVELLSCSVLALNFTQVLSHNSSRDSHNSSHTTPRIAQLISHKSTHSRAAFVWHLVELTELHRSSFTHLISCSVTCGVIRSFLCGVMKLPFHHERAVRVSALQQER